MDKFPLHIKLIEKSKLPEIDLQKAKFGRVFTDHMFVCDYADGRWQNPRITPYGPFVIDPSIKALHYGQAIFEGMKAFKDENEEVWLFRPDENAKRINKSAKRLDMPAFPEDWFLQGLKELLKIDKKWVPAFDGHSMYIRPFMFASENVIQADSSLDYKFSIILTPATPYYSGDISVKIEDKYSRSAPGGTGHAKAAGNYAGQFYPTKLANKQGFNQIIWTDSGKHEYLEESGTMNIFFRINNTLITAPTSDQILDGITRKSIITLAQNQGIEVQERPFTVSELKEAVNNNTLKEVFGCGTAIVTVNINKIGYKEEVWTVPTLAENDSYMRLLKNKMIAIQKNKSKDTFGWRVGIK